MKFKYNNHSQESKVVVHEVRSLVSGLFYHATKKHKFNGVPKFLSIENDLLSFEMPKKSCQIGFHLEILLVTLPAPGLEFKFTAKVIEIEESKRLQKVVLKLLQYVKPSLDAFHNLFLVEQRKVTELFNDLKGLEKIINNGNATKS